MSGEAWATLAGTVLGAILGYGLTQVQKYLDQRGKLEAYATLLLTEFFSIDLKLNDAAPGDLRPLLNLEVWKSTRLELAALLNDAKLLTSLTLIAHFVEEWNGDRKRQSDDWYITRAGLLKHLEIAIPKLQRLSKIEPAASK